MKKPLPDHGKPDLTWNDLGQPHSLALVRSLLDTDIDVRFTVTGQSMQPFLNSHETVTLRKETPARLRIGDLIFFRNNHKNLILHRIIRKKSSNDRIILYTKGDALSYPDEPIAAESILGKVMRIERAGRKAPVNLTAPMRIPVNYIIAWISRLQIHCNRITRIFHKMRRRIDKVKGCYAIH